MSAAREVFARFGIEVDDSKLKKLNENVTQASSGLHKFITGIAATATARAVFGFVEGLAEMGDRIADSSERLGISSDSFQALGLAADTGGSSVEGLSAALLGLQDRLADAASGGANAKVFKALGIATKDAAGNIRGTEDVLNDASDAIARMKNPAKQTEAAMNLFGRAGRELLPMLKDGKAGMEEARKKAVELGGGFSKDAVQASKGFSDALKDVSFAVNSVRGRIAEKLLPALRPLVDGMAKVIGKFVAFTKGTKIVETGLAVLGAVLAAFAIKAAIALAPVIAPFILWGAILAGVALVLEDIYVWLTGSGKSAIGEWLKYLYGVERANEILVDTRSLFYAISDGIQTGVRRLKEFLSFVTEIAPKVKEILSYLPPVLVARAAKFVGTKAIEGAGEFGDGVARGVNAFRDTRESVLNPDAPSSRNSIFAAAQRAVNSVANRVNLTINAPNADAREVVRIAKTEIANAHAASNRAAVLRLTREAPRR